MNEWKALNARISLFPIAPTEGTGKLALELYQKVWNSQPDNFNSSQNPMMPTIAQGRLGRMTVGCSTQHGRIDFNLGPTPPATSGGANQLMTIQDSYELRESLKLIKAIIAAGEIKPPLLRLAYVIQFVVPKPDAIACNAELMRVMPDAYRMKLTNEEDVNIQINRPCLSKVIDGMKLNQLSTWSAQKFQVLFIDALTGLPPIGQAPLNRVPLKTTEHLTASVVLEVNNIQTAVTLLSEQSASLLQEFLDSVENFRAELGLEIDGH